MDKGGLGSFGLSNPFQADAPAGSQLEPDFDHLDAPKLVKQLPRGQGGGAGLEFMFETHPQTVAQECDHEVSFDPLWGEVPNGPDGQIAFKGTENGFDFGQLDVLGPKFSRSATRRSFNAAILCWLAASSSQVQAPVQQLSRLNRATAAVRRGSIPEFQVI